MEIVIALLMIVNNEIKEHRIQESMSDCLKGKRLAMRTNKNNNIQYLLMLFLIVFLHALA